MNKTIKTFYDKLPLPLQDIIVNLKGYQIERERYGEKFNQLLKELEISQWKDLDWHLDKQNEKLRLLIAHAYEQVPYYREIMDEKSLKPSDFKNISDISKLPVLNKETVRKRQKDLMARNASRRKLKMGHTSGTTGSPLEVWWDIPSILISTATLWRFRGWAGLRYGDPFVTVTGNVIVPLAQKNPPFWRYNKFQNQLLVSSFHLTEQNIDVVLAKIRAFKPKAIDAYPSTAFILAKRLLDSSETLHLNSIITSSETLYTHQRELIEKGFGCRVYDFYASAERVVFATECEHHTGHHVYPEYGITEIVDARGNPCSVGITGRVIGTGLENFAMPLLRYEIGDMTNWTNICCPCGRNGMPMFSPITTKAEDMLVLSDGRIISPSILTHPFKPMHNIFESQIIQEEKDRIRILIVPRSKFSANDEKILVGALKERLGSLIKIEIELVSNIPRTSGGKLRWVISKVPSAYRVDALK